jgi:hypothetical protein
VIPGDFGENSILREAIGTISSRQGLPYNSVLGYFLSTYPIYHKNNSY